MTSFFNWLNTPGPIEEITLIIVILLLVVGVPVIIKFLNITKIGKDGIELNQSKPKKKKKNESNDESSESGVESNNKRVKETKQVNNNKVSIVATQDFKIFSLIIKKFNDKMKVEIKQYCRLNGLNLKKPDEYDEYIEVKKNLYFSELKELTRNEYVAYDTVSYQDIEKLLDNSRDFLFNKITNMYKKLRTISIEEHARIDNEIKHEFEEFKKELLLFFGKEKMNDNDVSVDSFIKLHAVNYKNIVLSERIDIIEKQLNSVEETNNIIYVKMIEEFEKIYRSKLPDDILTV